MLQFSGAYRIERPLAAEVSWPDFPAADFREPPFQVSEAKRSIELCSKTRAGSRSSRYWRTCNATWIRLTRTL